MSTRSHVLKAVAQDIKDKVEEAIINIVIRTAGLEIEWVEDEELSNNLATNLIDGDITNDSRWAAKFFPKSVIFDLGKPKNIIGTKICTFQNRLFQYSVEVSNEVSTGFTVISGQTNNTSKEQPLISDFNSATGRYVKITVTGVFGASVPWASLNEVEINTSDVLSIDQINKPNDSKFLIYPNLNNGNFIIESSNLLNAEVTIYALNGIRVFKVITNTNSFSVSKKFNNSVHVIKRNNSDKVFYKKDGYKINYYVFEVL